MTEKKYREKANGWIYKRCLNSEDHFYLATKVMDGLHIQYPEEYLKGNPDRFVEVVEKEKTAARVIDDHINNRAHVNNISGASIIRELRDNGFFIVKQTAVEEIAEKMFFGLCVDMAQNENKLRLAKIIEVLSSHFPAPPESKNE